MSKNEVTAAFLSAFTQAWNDKDIDKLMDHMSEGCVFMASVGVEVEGTKWEGFDNVRTGFASLWDAYSDAHFEPVGEDIIVGDRGCSEWIFTGTKVSDGTKVRARGCDVYTFRDGKILLKNSMRKQTP
ncbi:MAG: ketosteroid isomerase-like protein [Gammaproteobacteria bacterium]|jgi:ketosteroid isomerase-like protein